MAEQNYQQRKLDVESAAELSKEFKRKKRMKLFAYAAAFAIFQTVVILVFSLTDYSDAYQKSQVQGPFHHS